MVKFIEKKPTKTYIYTKLNYYIINKTLSIRKKNYRYIHNNKIAK